MDIEFYNWLKEKHLELTVLLTSIENGEEVDEETTLRLYKEFKFCNKEL